jgi:hypothetical protein
MKDEMDFLLKDPVASSGVKYPRVSRREQQARAQAYLDKKRRERRIKIELIILGALVWAWLLTETGMVTWFAWPKLPLNIIENFEAILAR